MKKKSIYILKVILGGYLVFIGVSLFVAHPKLLALGVPASDSFICAAHSGRMSCVSGGWGGC